MKAILPQMIALAEQLCLAESPPPYTCGVSYLCTLPPNHREQEHVATHVLEGHEYTRWPVETVKQLVTEEDS